MPRGPFYFPSKGICIYCGAKDVPLTDEHIVPYSLGGNHVIREASCSVCADITKRFEQDVARGLWGDARTSYKAPTRRKKERRSHIEMRDPHNLDSPLTVLAAEYPAGFVFYKMDKAGILRGAPESQDFSGAWQMIVVDDDKRREAFVAKHGRQPVLRFKHVHLSFARMLAKIGHCQTLTLLDMDDFRPLCVPYVLGDAPNVSYVVGGSLENHQPEPDNGYRMSSFFFGDWNRMLIAAEIRLLANCSTPLYHAIVGEVIGPENIKRVVEKLSAKGGGIEPVARNTHHAEPI